MKLLCLMQEVCRLTSEYGANFQKEHQLCLNEGMVLCLLEKERLLSGTIAARLGLSTSNTSKIVGMLDSKGMVERVMAADDKRQMYYAISEHGRATLKKIKESSSTPPAEVVRIVQQMTELMREQ